jgi:BirA family biotin operon repressor/biotin-[acetyl-CoA-carboxylase] ligase
VTKFTPEIIADTYMSDSSLNPFPPLPQAEPSKTNWLHELTTCPSTNTWALEHATELKHGDVVLTQQQTAGRGQHGRVWYAPAGALTASFVLDLPGSQLSGLSLVAGLAVIYAIEDLLPSLQGQLRLKWPNDVLLEQRKLAGILSEATTAASQARVVIGVGLNRAVNFAEAGLDPNLIGNPISLNQVATNVPEERALVAQIRHYLMQVRDLMARTGSGIEALLPALRQRDILLHRSVTLELADRQITGQAAGIDASGRLLLQFAESNQVQAFSSGRVVEWESA